ncbi:CtsR family transcriptional regulator [Alkalibacillus silvisoli]|uniref:Transcriptional regulator CtsR n=1 Tax=Alkalibacillus silvisoli TaxID=392823 RepID=A0ABN1A828_9BACI
MRNISDVIEDYLKQIIQSSNSDVVELKRSEIAESFECVPSQINYVINTRFTLEKGYLVESKRGGGGYIRIIRLKPKSNQELIKEMDLVANQPLTQQSAFDLVERLKEEDLITEREKRLMLKVMHRDILDIPLPHRDLIRSKIFKELLTTIKMHG